MIPLCYDPTEIPLCHDEFGDVWKGQRDGMEVAAKVLRVYPMSDTKRTTKVGSLVRYVHCLPIIQCRGSAGELSDGRSSVIGMCYHYWE